MRLSEYEEAVLRLVQSQSPTIERIVDEFDGVFTKSEVKDLVRALKDRKYIKIEVHLAAGVYSLGSSVDDAVYDNDYVLTPLGKNYLANATSNFTSFSNITNSNIAHQSTNVKQKINLSELPDDIRDKVLEIDSAVKRKDSNALSKAFTYIADKSVDVAIALLVGGINK